MTDVNKNFNNKSMILNLTLEGFEGPIDLLLNLVREQKIDLSKIQILPLAEQYLNFLKKIIKQDIDIAAEYLVIGAVLAYIKSRLLLPSDENTEDDPELLSELLRLQILKLETFQKLSKSIFSRKQLGRDFFSRGEREIFSKKIKYKYDLNLFELTKIYSEIVKKENSDILKISESKLFTVEKAINYLIKMIPDLKNWKDISLFIPEKINNYLEYKSAYASYFVASLELTREGKILLKQNLKNNLEIIQNN